MPGFDVVLLSSGHWFAKQYVYALNNEVVGGQLWWPDKSRSMKVNNTGAYGISAETVLSAFASHPNYTGLTIVRSYSPDHYEGGKFGPQQEGELLENAGFNRAIEKVTDKSKSKLRLMDITEAFGYRHDGHPDP
ncbi:hypothetical protein SAY86_005714 [Trapa natans]|uniref:Trichome birefringence-like C-terminal domain-containing protein n=1 Tax=Trapa natans TaxID=22666 RepID=A0AAN7L170_TRANT|nr:hypothetical protein SAY86_005714 [Trapa natans]